MKRKICVVTGTRAEYGALKLLMQKIKNDDTFELQLVVTGMHLSPEFGYTYKHIIDDGFEIDEKLEILLSSDTTLGVVKSMGLGTIGIGDAFQRLEPDLVIILGDRFEMLSIAQVALIMQIPIAHLHGGECTFGAYDDAIRHSITKMATWHFTSTESYRQRVIQLGENPKRVFNVGSLSIENILNIPLLPRKNVYELLKFEDECKYMIITLHPETTQNKINMIPFFNALASFSDYKLVFTKANADNGGREINRQLEEFVLSNSNARLFDSLGIQRYLSVAKYSTLVVGNSSSGIGEIPYLHIPTVNCGKRQDGRLKPSSIIETDLYDEQMIKQAIKQAINYDGTYDRLFGDGHTSDEIISILREIDNYKINKEFWDL